MTSDVFVTGISIWKILGYFVAYLVIHIGIGVVTKYYEQKVQEFPNKEEYKGQLKISKAVFKWFPAVYLVFILIALYV